MGGGARGGALGLENIWSVSDGPHSGRTVGDGKGRRKVKKHIIFLISINV